MKGYCISKTLADCVIGDAISDAKMDPSDGTDSLFSQSRSVWCLYMPNYKNYAERDAFWAVGGGPSAYISRDNSDIRR